VTATNETAVTVTDTHTIVITDAVPSVVAPVTVTITGPETGEPGVPYTFTVTVDPEDVTTPITYEVQYTDGSAPMGPLSLNQRVVNTPGITWATTGTKTIWVKASNEEGFAIGTREIGIGEESVEPQTIFLPLVIRNYPLLSSALEGTSWSYNAIRVSEAWASSTGEGIIVADVGSGVDLDRPYLAANIVVGYDFVDDD
jgi:subtilisin family serine protease